MTESARRRHYIVRNQSFRCVMLGGKSRKVMGFIFAFHVYFLLSVNYAHCVSNGMFAHVIRRMDIWCQIIMPLWSLMRNYVAHLIACV